MKAYLLAAVAALALGGAAKAEVGDPWMLLTLGWYNGEGPHAFDTNAVEQFPTKSSCEAELRNQVHKRDGLSHAAGGDFMALCSNVGAPIILTERKSMPAARATGMNERSCFEARPSGFAFSPTLPQS